MATKNQKPLPRVTLDDALRAPKTPPGMRGTPGNAGDLDRLMRRTAPPQSKVTKVRKGS